MDGVEHAVQDLFLQFVEVVRAENPVLSTARQVDQVFLHLLSVFLVQSRSLNPNGENVDVAGDKLERGRQRFRSLRFGIDFPVSQDEEHFLGGRTSISQEHVQGGNHALRSVGL